MNPIEYKFAYLIINKSVTNRIEYEFFYLNKFVTVTDQEKMTTDRTKLSR